MDETIHAGHRARLREVALNDPELVSFSDFQTLEYLLSFLIPRKDTNPIAHQLINEFGSLNGVLHADMQELVRIPNMTKNAATLIPSLYSIIRKSELSRINHKKYVSTVDDAVEFFRPYFLGRYEELAYCMVLDLNDRVLQVSLISEGMSDNTSLNSNKIVSMVTRNKAKKVIIAHNHPGGSLQPSKEDLDATSGLFVILHTLNAVLADHLIFADDKYYSFFVEGWYEKLLAGAGIMELESYNQLRTCRLNRVYFFEEPQHKGEKI